LVADRTGPLGVAPDPLCLALHLVGFA